MKKQNDLQWFLIKKFIEILAVVGKLDIRADLLDLEAVGINKEDKRRRVDDQREAES